MIEIIDLIFSQINNSDILIAFLSLHIIAFFAGYPLVFQILTTLSNTGSKRRLTENFLESKSTIWLKWLSFIGIVVTGLTLILLIKENSYDSYVLLFISVSLFFIVAITFLIYINNALNHVYRHDKIIETLNFDIFKKGDNFKTLKFSLKTIRKIFKSSQPKITKKANKYRTELAILHELILDYSSRIGYEELIHKLCYKLFVALNRENLYELSEIEHGKTSNEIFNETDSLLSSITENTFTNIQQSYSNAATIINKSTIIQIESFLNSLLLEHSRHVESGENPQNASLMFLMSEKMVCEILEFTYELLLKNLKSIYVYSNLPIYTYNNILFLKHDRPFEILMVHHFDNYIENIGTAIIANNNIGLYKNLIGYLYDGPRFHPILSNVINDIIDKILYNKLYGNINISDELINEIKSLEYNMSNIYTVNDYKSFIEHLRDILSNEFSDDTLETYCIEISREAEEWLKLNHLRESLFNICAWCLNENKINFIRIMWEYHQPPDSTAIYGDNTLLPSDLKSSLKHCFLVRRPDDRHRDFNWPGHHGKGVWFCKYLILHFCAVMDNRLQDNYHIKNHNNDINTVIKTFFDEIKDANKAYSLTIDFDQLIIYANEMVKDENILNELGFDINDKNPIEKNVIPLLQEVKSAADDKLKELTDSAEINQEMVKDFFERIRSGFKCRLDILQILNNNSTTKNDHVVVRNKTYYDNWIPKDYFIKNHYIDTSSVGPEYGTELARLIEYQILYIITKMATTISFQQFISIHVQDHTEWVLISAPNAIGYKSKWRNEFDIFTNTHDSDEKTMDNCGYRGMIKVGNCSIKIFSIKNQPMFPFPEDSTILIPLSRLGKIKISPKEQKYKDDIKFSFNSNEILSESEISIRLHEPSDSNEKDINKLYLTISAEFEWSFSNDSKAGKIWLVSP